MHSDNPLDGLTRLEDWKNGLETLRRTRPDTWVSTAFLSLGKRFQTEGHEAFCGAIFEVGVQRGWGDQNVDISETLIEVMSFDAWHLVPWILRLPQRAAGKSEEGEAHFTLKESYGEISYLALRGLDRGVWTHLDLLCPTIFQGDEGLKNVRRVGHDIFKHNEFTYYSPLRPEVIERLAGLPHHPDAGAILGKSFAVQQRDADCFTDINLPGVFDALVIMAKSGWLDTAAARREVRPSDAQTLDKIARIEAATLSQTAKASSGTRAPRRV